MRANMSMQVVSVVSDPEWKGSKLIQLQNEVARPTSADLSKNTMWIRPLISHFRDKAHC